MLTKWRLIWAFTILGAFATGALLGTRGPTPEPAGYERPHFIFLNMRALAWAIEDALRPKMPSLYWAPKGPSKLAELVQLWREEMPTVTLRREGLEFAVEELRSGSAFHHGWTVIATIVPEVISDARSEADRIVVLARRARKS